MFIKGLLCAQHSAKEEERKESKEREKPSSSRENQELRAVHHRCAL
jgi:hypothetical protein